MWLEMSGLNSYGISYVCPNKLKIARSYGFRQLIRVGGRVSECLADNDSHGIRQRWLTYVKGWMDECWKGGRKTDPPPLLETTCLALQQQGKNPTSIRVFDSNIHTSILTVLTIVVENCQNSKPSLFKKEWI